MRTDETIMITPLCNSSFAFGHHLKTPCVQAAMSYVIAGRKVLNEHIVLLTFGTVGFLSWLGTRGGPTTDPLAVPLNATSKEQESFIRNRLIEKEREAHDKQLKLKGH